MDKIILLLCFLTLLHSEVLITETTPAEATTQTRDDGYIIAEVEE